ncbi:hypothetical protein E2C04_06595 [Nocardioides daphniae]|uniref:N-acetyltransferase domain-containing protein n=1 Tax=Nocardioides daphniae TaxID=402297 RepID=A0A4P7UEB2_9ACTN|nr:hypothetical protein E2C04_06595 [Nocardioides daphniae]
MERHWVDVLGWGGSVLLVYSLLQSRVLRLRWLNLAACVLLVVFNARLGVWPMVAMNLALSAINLWFIVQLSRARHDEASFTVLEVGADDAYLAHVLSVHRTDIARFQPDFTDDRLAGADCFLVQRADETVGVVVLRREGDEARVVLDYVTPRYRDFSPGEFVWRRSSLLRETGVRRVVTNPAMVQPYYERLGFRRAGEAWVLELAA